MENIFNLLHRIKFYARFLLQVTVENSKVTDIINFFQVIACSKNMNAKWKQMQKS